MRFFAVIFVLFFSIGANSDTTYQYKQPEASRPRIAIIIDDIGYNLALGRRTIALKGAVTLAVLPHTPGAVVLAKEGYAVGKEIMLHAPMSNKNDKALGPGALTPNLSKEEFLKVLRGNLESIPHVHGVNNHMGSELTTLETPMQWVMEELHARKLFFIDSLTNGKSIALKVARQHGVTSAKRDIFLDHVQTEVEIERAFKQTIQTAKKQGYAIAIGHPYPETLAVLERNLPQLDDLGVRLVTISEIILFNNQ